MKIPVTPEEAERYAKIVAEDSGGDLRMSYSQRVDHLKGNFLKDGIHPETLIGLEREIRDR